MKQGNGTEILGPNDPRVASIGIIHVAPTDERKNVPLIVDAHAMILRINLSASKSAFPCHDLLGRKHNLEFLGTDGETSRNKKHPIPLPSSTHD